LRCKIPSLDVGTGSTTAVLIPLALGLLHHSHPTLAARMGTSFSSHF
jgi:hypothetical protein